MSRQKALIYITLTILMLGHAKSSIASYSGITILSQSDDNPLSAQGPWAVSGLYNEYYYFHHIIITVFDKNAHTAYETPCPSGITSVIDSTHWASGNLPPQPASGNYYSVYADLYSYSYFYGVFLDATSDPWNIVAFQ